MRRLVPHNNIIALAIAPSVWLAYFVLTYLATEIGCARGWETQRIAGMSTLHAILWAISLIGFAFISYASVQAFRNIKEARDPEHFPEPEDRARHAFIAKAGLFLCGISLLGTLWGAINIVVFEACTP